MKRKIFTARSKDIAAGVFLCTLLIVCLIFAGGCAGMKEGAATQSAASAAGTGDEKVLGFGILRRLPGLWHGPVMTTTPAGSFPMWYVDFRPVAPGKASQYSNLDPDTINYLSFFVVKHDGRFKVAMRTEGVFRSQGCVTYEVIDTVREEEGYYRFSDFVAGDNRAYTNRFNKVAPLEIHTRWNRTMSFFSF